MFFSFLKTNMQVYVFFNNLINLSIYICICMYIFSDHGAYNRGTTFRNDFSVSFFCLVYTAVCFANVNALL